uniref:Uncharacterized protein n=1 Tax=Arundo donax TaxID=35708 RepID=A0A0A9A9R0_ARUDO
MRCVLPSNRSGVSSTDIIPQLTVNCIQSLNTVLIVMILFE